MSVLIGHVAVDKNGLPTGGSSGASKTDTIFIRPFYDKQWHTIYRPTGDRKAEIVASTMENICNNDNIYYSEQKHYELYAEAQKNKWDASKIVNKCGTNTAMTILVLVRALGEVLGNSETFTFDGLKYLLTRAGFQVFKFKDKEELRRGDILVGDVHAAVVLSDGNNVDKRTPAQKLLDKQSANQAFVGKDIGIAIARTSISVYSGPGIHFIEYKVVPKNTELSILEVLPDGWFKIVYPYVQAGYGYVQDLSGTALKIVDESILPKEEEEEELGTPVNYEIYLKGQNSVVNIRKGPGKEYAVAGNIRNRQKYTIIKEHEGWGYLSTQAGWVNLAKVNKL